MLGSSSVLSSGLQALALSPDALKVAEFLVLRSQTGCQDDPTVTLDQLHDALGLDPQASVDAILELADENLVNADEDANSTLGYDRVRPTNTLFVRLDSLFTDHDPATDAHLIGTDLIDQKWDGSNMPAYATRLGWTIRRLNPALLYLIDADLVQTTGEVSYPWVACLIWPNSRLRRWLRQRR